MSKQSSEAIPIPTYMISIYPHFHCLGGDCPHSCCKGWQIVVDPATYDRYRAARGSLGRSLRFHVYRWKGARYLRKQFGRCPFWNSDRHCQLQANGEPMLMPLICRLYPRDVVESDVEREVTLELSCIAAARLFLEHPGRLAFVPMKEEVETLWKLENHEPEYYRLLKADREKMLDYLWDGGDDLATVWQTLYAYVYHKHDHVVMGRFEEAMKVVLSSDPEEQGEYYLNRDPTYCFFSIKTLDRMIISQIDYGNLKRRERAFFKLIESYRKRFGKLYIDEAERFFDGKVRQMMQEGYGEKYRSYFSYCMQELYLHAYETYHILREFLFAVLYVQLLMVFDLVDYLDRGEETADLGRQSEILMLCEQGIRHNSNLTQNLLQIIREEFL